MFKVNNKNIGATSTQNVFRTFLQCFNFCTRKCQLRIDSGITNTHIIVALFYVIHDTVTIFIKVKFNVLNTQAILPAILLIVITFDFQLFKALGCYAIVDSTICCCCCFFFAHLIFSSNLFSVFSWKELQVIHL